ncbi:hypothetical protein ACSQ67_007615 [Phaseolus vulgaris]
MRLKQLKDQQTSVINHGEVGMEGGKGAPKTILLARFSGEDELECGGLVLNSISNSFSEDGINNCNKRFWNSIDIDRPVKLWELGKQIGISCEANEVEAINEMVLMEKKDLKGKKKGGKGRKYI